MIILADMGLMFLGLGLSALFGLGTTIYGQITQRKAENNQAQYQQAALKLKAMQINCNKKQRLKQTKPLKTKCKQSTSSFNGKKDKESDEVAATRKVSRNATKIDPNSGISEQDSNNDMYGMGLRIPTK